MNYNPSPKSEFVKDAQLVKNHHAVVENDDLRVGLETALLEYQRKQVSLSAPDLGGCAACHLRMQGALEFIETFLNLAETVTAAAPADKVNLPGNIARLNQK